MAHTCKSCGAVADDPGHLCNPVLDEIDCSFCGEKNVGIAHVCKAKLAALKYSCESCGRVAAKSGDLCKQTEIT